MELLQKLPLDGFTLYFVGYDHSETGLSAEEKAATRRAREGSMILFCLSPIISCPILLGVLELWHTHGTESDPEFAGYASGNDEPGRGFGHIAISVDNVEAACEHFEKLGVSFQKRPNEGNFKGFAFILDPDGYWIEIVPNTRNVPFQEV
jgi:lactoylglutathione lyase